MFTRLSVAAGFLSAVADRLGVLGPHGARNVSWGDMQHFYMYTQQVNTYAPSWIVPMLAWSSTIVEGACGVLLVAGYRKREVAIASGCLLLVYAAAMTVSLGIKSILDYSVLPAAAAAFFLARVER